MQNSKHQKLNVLVLGLIAPLTYNVYKLVDMLQCVCFLKKNLKFIFTIDAQMCFFRSFIALLLCVLVMFTFHGCKKEVTSSASADFTYEFDNSYEITPFSPVLVYFNNKSVNAESYVWNFGDGGSSTEENPKHVYMKGGHYEVLLIVTDNNGVSTERIKVITVNENPSKVRFDAFLVVKFPFKNGYNWADVHFEVLDEDSNLIYKSDKHSINRYNVEYGYAVGSAFTIEDFNQDYVIKWYDFTSLVARGVLRTKLPVSGFYQKTTAQTFDNLDLEYRVYREWFE